MRYGEWRFRGDNEIENVVDDEWILRVDDAELRGTVSNLKENCWRVTAVDDPSGNLLNNLHVAEDSFTFDIRWRDATEAELILRHPRRLLET